MNLKRHITSHLENWKRGEDRKPLIIRGAGTVRPFGDFDTAYGRWEIEAESYTHKDRTKFDCLRCHILGRRTNHWGRISLRFGPDYFMNKSIDVPW